MAGIVHLWYRSVHHSIVVSSFVRGRCLLQPFQKEGRHVQTTQQRVGWWLAFFFAGGPLLSKKKPQTRRRLEKERLPGAGWSPHPHAPRRAQHSSDELVRGRELDDVVVVGVVGRDPVVGGGELESAAVVGLGEEHVGARVGRRPGRDAARAGEAERHAEEQREGRDDGEEHRVLGRRRRRRRPAARRRRRRLEIRGGPCLPRVLSSLRPSWLRHDAAL
mmetsp:Transcript_15502/g.62409  ORF Transcript_15502/g.62409 Transcript_15502/m.62409 type:complete len:219 (+) Transcript_15502:980-1636(+)